METEEKPSIKWQDSLWTLLLGVAVAGPLALPLLWRNPRFSRKTKIWVSVGVILFTIFLTIFAGALIVYMIDQLYSGLSDLN